MDRFCVFVLFESGRKQAFENDRKTKTLEIGIEFQKVNIRILKKYIYR